MKLLLHCCLLFLLLPAGICYGQRPDPAFSVPLDLKETGWNKVLCLKNGNTMLFHLEPGKRPRVKVFDSSHHETGSQQEPYDVLDVVRLESAVFKGLYEINGEAVLFIDQEHYSKHSLVRLQYNIHTGQLINEEQVRESHSLNRKIQFEVMKEKGSDNYAVLFCIDISHPKRSTISVGYYNGRHELTREVALPVDRKNYDMLYIVGAAMHAGSVMVSLGLGKVLVSSPHATFGPEGSVYNYYLRYFYLAENADTPKTMLADLGNSYVPVYAFAGFDQLAAKTNLLLYTIKREYTRFGGSWITRHINHNIAFALDTATLAYDSSTIRNAMATEYLRQNTGNPARVYDAVPVAHDVQAGGCTLFSVADVAQEAMETADRYAYEDYIGNMGITRYNAHGQELWGAVLPLSQYFKSYRHSFSMLAIAQRQHSLLIFGDLPDQVYNRQLVSPAIYSYGGNSYIIYNDYKKNLGNGLKNTGDTVYALNTVNACYCRISAANEVVKSYLFTGLQDREYICSFVEGADVDEQRGIYASLVRCTRNGEATLKMAWKRLD